MKKRILAIAFSFLMLASSLHAGITLRYHNSDSEEHVMEVKIEGRSTKVEFESSRTASVTIQGSSKECVIYTDCGKVTVKDGDKIEIKNGCIKVN